MHGNLFPKNDGIETPPLAPSGMRQASRRRGLGHEMACIAGWSRELPSENSGSKRHSPNVKTKNKIYIKVFTLRSVLFGVTAKAERSRWVTRDSGGTEAFWEAGHLPLPERCSKCDQDALREPYAVFNQYSDIYTHTQDNRGSGITDRRQVIPLDDSFYPFL